MSTERFYVIEGDDHEQRIVSAETAEDALEECALGFSDQYGEEYEADLLVVLGSYDDEDAAQVAFPEAEA